MYWAGGPVELSQRQAERERTAVHEAGHALMAWRMGHDIERISIRPRHRALGHVRTLAAEDKNSHTQADVVGNIAVCFSGLCAETAVLGGHSTGASSDLDAARRWARTVVRAEGMIDSLPAGAPAFSTITQVSPQQHAAIDDAEHTLLSQARSNTQEWMNAHVELIRELAAYLVKQSELEADEVRAWMHTRLEVVGEQPATLAAAARTISGLPE